MENNFDSQYEQLEKEFLLKKECQDLDYQVTVLRRLLFMSCIMGLIAACSSLLAVL